MEHAKKTVLVDYRVLVQINENEKLLENNTLVQ